ncbi:nucleolar zinc-finger protein [Elasticomyces elasticus]|nr:nucleolar zinc-finger protein [Elasticomyces elasticus]KAK4992492.1 nucleolar zinc-finger protein [Elasticomyces elasticus]
MSGTEDAAIKPGKPLAQDLFEDMGRQVESMRPSGSQENDETDQKVVEEIESLCMNCHEDGVTRLLLTRIPFFREIVIMSFSCEHCHFKNSEIQSAGEIQQRGARYTLRLEREEDFQRQVVKSDTCTLRVEDIDLEIPPGRGQYTNIEGVVSSVRQDLESQQAARMEQMPEIAKKVAVVIQSLVDMLDGKRYPFTISADDPSGNSWIEPSMHDKGGKYTKHEFSRTAEQNAALGLGDTSATADGVLDSSAPATEIRPEYHASGMVPALPERNGITTNNVDDEDIIENEVYSFPASCPGCTRSCATNMKMVNIPHFKQVVLMSTVCEHCGYRSNEVKTGGKVPELGRKITLRVQRSDDLARDVLKSESAALYCPELQLRVEPGTLGGKFTTVEGLLTQFRNDLRAQAFGLEDGDADEVPASDSMEPDAKRTWTEFFEGLSAAIGGNLPFTMILEDPLASSYVQSYTAPEPDPQIDVEDYERTHEEEEHLGLNDIKTEDYEEEHAAEQARIAAELKGEEDVEETTKGD